MSNAYLVLVTWPDGSEGLLFPRPGNVPINTTEEQGLQDYAIAVDHLNEWLESNPAFKEKTKVRLVKFHRLETVKEYPEPVVEKIPPTVLPTIRQEAEWIAQHTCPKCGRVLSHTHKFGYICEYCSGIED